ncbi:PLP-dependent aminotransferase family protein [Halomonas sp. DP1Y21-3]|uniref:aminotransferase-like domain-containing protein n=1 Tax=Halomonas sp. DP1Y21-3 TaxID=2859080 RepID=UPI001C97D04C|nr:PLP-dependent aminotransferase family protein [Halomonas sp. DP1Y21-3]MBY6112305.1 PLP-dependent aminotransferase family protein [Halomonas sp. DP1Y21-3]
MTIWTPSLEFDSSSARYRQIASAIGEAIDQGQLAAGDRLPPQRALADALGVTVGTITRAYSEAQQRGWVSSRVGSGTYVNDAAAGNSPFDVHVAADSDGVVDMSLSFAPPHPWRHQCLQQALAEVTEDPACLAMVAAYQPDIGTRQHREALSRWLEDLGFPLHEVLAITQGGQHGIDLCLRALTRPGDSVAADALTYPGFNAATRHAHLKPMAVPLDDDGMDIDALARLCQRQVPRLVYLTPDQNNPTSAVLSPQRREQLAALARRHDFWLIEDAVQYLPREDRGVSLLELAPERTLQVFSTSKVLSGGLRVGTLQMPATLRERIGSLLRAQLWMCPPLMTEVARRWIASPRYPELLAWQTAELAARQRLARASFEALTPRHLTHGANFWLPLPEGRRASEVQALLKSEGVLVATPEPFCTGSEPAPQAIRLCVGAPESRESLQQALATVRRVLEQGDTSPWATL